MQLYSGHNDAAYCPPGWLHLPMIHEGALGLTKGAYLLEQDWRSAADAAADLARQTVAPVLNLNLEFLEADSPRLAWLNQTQEAIGTIAQAAKRARPGVKIGVYGMPTDADSVDYRLIECGARHKVRYAGGPTQAHRTAEAWRAEIADRIAHHARPVRTVERMFVANPAPRPWIAYVRAWYMDAHESIDRQPVPESEHARIVEWAHARGAVGVCLWDHWTDAGDWRVPLYASAAATLQRIVRGE